MKNIIIIFLLFTLSGCGTFKKVFKSKESSKSETVVKSKKDSAGLTIDKSKTVVKEKADTSVIIPTKKVKQDTAINMDSLVNGLTAIRSDLVEVYLIYNPVTGILSTEAILKPQTIPFRFDRETTTENDILKQSNLKEESTNTNKHKTESTVKETEPAKMGIWLLAIVVGIILVIAAIKIVKNYRC